MRYQEVCARIPMPQDTLALCLSLPLYLRMQRPVTTLPAGHLFASGLPIEQTNETKSSPSLHFAESDSDKTRNPEVAKSVVDAYFE